jgi:hypothetical protein
MKPGNQRSRMVPIPAAQPQAVLEDERGTRLYAHQDLFQGKEVLVFWLHQLGKGVNHHE